MPLRHLNGMLVHNATGHRLAFGQPDPICSQCGTAATPARFTLRLSGVILCPNWHGGPPSTIVLAKNCTFACTWGASALPGGSNDLLCGVYAPSSGNYTATFILYNSGRQLYVNIIPIFGTNGPYFFVDTPLTPAQRQAVCQVGILGVPNANTAGNCCAGTFNNGYGGTVDIIPGP